MTTLLGALKPNRYVFLLFALLLLFQLVVFSCSTFQVTLAPAYELDSGEVERVATDTWESRLGVGAPVIIERTRDTRKIDIRWQILAANLGACYLLSVLLMRGAVGAARLLRSGPPERAAARVEQWLNGPGWRLFSALGALVLWLLWLGLQPGFYYLVGLCLVIMAWMLFLLVLIVRLGVQGYLARQHRSSAPKWTVPALRYACFIGTLLAATILLFFTMPLRLGFLTAKSTLSRLVDQDKLSLSRELTEDVRAGVYVVSAGATNRRRERGIDTGKRIVFILADDHEAGFIYSPGGIDDLAYNDGNKGHLLGDWYWMKED